MKTELILLTGFLGSGKTTLMQRLLDQCGSDRVGVIVNEFGSVNIDAKLIERDGITMAELSNGSIFCACIKDNFVDSLIEMSSKGLSRLFIETSGLADPANMERILEGISHKTGEGYEYLGSVCIVDAENFLGLAEMLPAIKAQAEYASAIVINKTDLADPDELEETVQTLKGWNPSALLQQTTYCQVDIRGLLDAISSVTDLPESRETTNDWKNRANTIVVSGKTEVPYEKLAAFIKAVQPDSYRVKGFGRTDRGNVEVSAVGKNLKIDPWKGPVDETQIVIISSIGFGIMSTVTKALQEHLDGELSL